MRFLRLGFVAASIAIVTIGVFFDRHQPQARAQTDPFATLQPGEWYRVPNSHLENVAPNPPAPNYTWPNVMDPWSSGAYDTVRDRLIVWGGGHGDYSGNEIYAFDIATLQWLRINDPSQNVGGDESTGVYPDGLPRSRHTYDSIEYLGAPIDRFCGFGAGGYYLTSQVGSPRVDCFNFSSNQWERYADALTFSRSCSAYDPVTHHAWVHALGGARQLAEFDPVANTWTARSSTNNDIYYVNCEIDPVRRQFYAIGDRTSYGGPVAARWSNIDSPGFLTRTNLATTGDKAMENVSNPGLAYDPVSDRLVAWNGGADVYTLNPDTLVWTKVTPAQTNTVIPTAANLRGTYGRFRYIPSKNAFIAVNKVDEDVYLYRLSGTTPPPDTTAPSAVINLLAE